MRISDWSSDVCSSDLIEVDNEDPAALRHWQHQVGALGDHAEIADWRPPDYRAWRLVERRLLNPGSTGGEAWHLALVPEDPADLRWEAGAVAEIGPRSAERRVGKKGGSTCK